MCRVRFHLPLHLLPLPLSLLCNLSPPVRPSVRPTLHPSLSPAVHILLPSPSPFLLSQLTFSIPFISNYFPPVSLSLSLFHSHCLLLSPSLSLFLSDSLSPPYSPLYHPCHRHSPHLPTYEDHGSVDGFAQSLRCVKAAQRFLLLLHHRVDLIDHSAVIQTA